ncbi:gustatory receptor for bitter taste 66a-like [Musca autumnalis]|uniref:gustatory receptor for bitter taste 66a-like n=1 Tax=Musca autumnalis TaxID=221902 RepID=UPI003CE67A6F
MTRKAETLKPINRKKQQQQQLPTRPLLEEFSILFYIGKFLGINPQDFREFRKYRHLERSQTGEFYSTFIIVMVVINFNLMVWVFQDPEYSVEKDNLTVAIGFILTYSSLFIYLSDRITGLKNQNQFIDLFENFQELEEELLEHGIRCNNSIIKYRVIFFIIMSTISETLVFVFTFAFLVDRDSWSAWLWTFTAVPTYCNSIDKIWFFGILLAIKKRFEALNNEFDNIAEKIEKNIPLENNSIAVISSVQGDKLKKSKRKIRVQPVLKNANHGIYLSEVIRNHPTYIATSPPSTKGSVPNTPQFTQAITFETLEDKFVKLCQLHNDLCTLAVDLNDLWAFPNLALMGYGFIIITAQLYFFYCSNANQVIPSLFRPASNLAITIIYLFYVAVKCISILLLSWLTTVESKKTGVCIHRCALASDTNEVYELVNHLSLKLFNHVTSFNACGYFSLDMDTLFGFCGGISTYLIILIQFNIEQQQVKSSSANGRLLSPELDNNETLTNIPNISSMFMKLFQFDGDLNNSFSIYV